MVAGAFETFGHVGNLLLPRTVKDDPDCEVVRKILKAVRRVRCCKQQITGADCRNVVTHAIVAASGGYKIEFVPIVRHLWAERRSLGHIDLDEVPIAE